ncbi:GNAT family N-acetyltransferase [Dyadobacter sp. CY345]|uniref:GNAT family N-acetyltransferase n=1 Tax=Dyadobacter sp. CY345 TaxID=2909335 RepID=UPI001F43AA47|nr:GNAT family N-acetyltransferase [Dyadobacter sp. CY345]MCF2444352.1 GNAT family N-acetyltransferase [Dyadobacter sp. CY345]
MISKPNIEPVYNLYSQQIVDLIIPIQQIEFGVPITLADQPDLMDIEKNYHSTGGNFWAAFHERKVVGTIALIAIGDGKGVIRKMFVNKDFRGKEFGIAQNLLNELIDYSNSKGITDLYLGTVDILKAAIRFYERNGFVAVEKNNLPETFPIMSADNVFYHLEIK